MWYHVQHSHNIFRKLYTNESGLDSVLKGRKNVITNSSLIVQQIKQTNKRQNKIERVK